MFLNDTIAAISTPLGTGSISIIRISGPEAIKKICKIFKFKNSKKKNLLKELSHTIHNGFILDEKGDILDEVLISIFKKPNSFTGEDIIEINGHGGILISQLLLERVLSLGIRLAQPGEFSKRAFLNNKIDLTQAESIMDLIHAQNENALKLAQFGLQKNTFKLVSELQQDILSLLGEIEVNIDYPEYDDIPIVTNKKILFRTKILIDKIKNILNCSVKNTFIKNGIKTLILGKPNVGKSSLLNILLNEERAIVSDIAGTTRDFVSEQVNIGGINLNLIDTAGIRETQDYLEKIGIQKAKHILKDTELVLLVLDQSNELEKDDEFLLKLTKKHFRILIGSKSDLPNKLNIPSLNEKVILISNITKKGINFLKENILKMFKLNKLQNKDFNYLSNARHIKQVKIALNSLIMMEKNLNHPLIPIDMYTIYLKEAYESLGEILGSNTKDSLINELFSKFCLGK
ncbi:tRNA uridine-5-carboxymethylaminomethyl(34) synthesis GTPase MnmE [Texas Phoenix palm phytoplasma]|uniref:tRNA modification GTPase MnmE n=1 Tax=Texas Phoenix palm phytoplasma TaxID=176709 RepID=A0ABS5BIC7_9MOLU|nr:tRNA uridine-5-carboxymethylaminomethyl(34) synthesis GTPase MnmE [Texas Phoenix palm phytoplasma]MBP3059330.1 tRNA uridine-5-carboxymethylaminomethyl(34) synthesis GTPase MnmE [Texas Phoenix palm phytoplasma]